jgi:hypothetical protein
LEKDGFLDAQGKLSIKYYIRPMTYQQLAKDQNDYIVNLIKLKERLKEKRNKKEILEQQPEKIEEEKKQLTIEGKDKSSKETQHFIDNNEEKKDFIGDLNLPDKIEDENCSSKYIS